MVTQPEDELRERIAALIAARPERRECVARALRATLEMIEDESPRTGVDALGEAFAVASVGNALKGFAAALALAADHAELLAERGERLLITLPPRPRPANDPVD